LAGHTHLGTHIIDTHRGQVIDPVWEPYRRTIELTGPVSTIIEWDEAIPSIDVLAAEADKARRARRRAGEQWSLGMNELDEIQALMAEQLRTRRALPKDVAVSAPASESIQPSGSLSPVERLEIYREQLWPRHTSSLVEDFPGLSGILGQTT
jgi:Protein of unknown function (DUF692)